jgi:hypothetical protein
MKALASMELVAALGQITSEEPCSGVPYASSRMCATDLAPASVAAPFRASRSVP